MKPSQFDSPNDNGLYASFRVGRVNGFVSMHQHGNEPCQFDSPSVSNDNGLYASFRVGGVNGIYFSFESHVELAKFAAGLSKLSAEFTECVRGKRAADPVADVLGDEYAAAELPF